MAETSKNRKDASTAKSRTTTQPSRLERRRPAALQIAPASSNQWNAAIPLLSPLESSPTAIDLSKSQSKEEVQQHQRNQAAEVEKPVVFKKWQHPAAPFCYDSAQFVPSFFMPV